VVVELNRFLREKRVNKFARVLFLGRKNNTVREFDVDRRTCLVRRLDRILDSIKTMQIAAPLQN
jgi:hypothetical protein